MKSHWENRHVTCLSHVFKLSRMIQNSFASEMVLCLQVDSICDSNICFFWVGAAAVRPIHRGLFVWIAMPGSFAKVVPTADAPDAPHEVVEKGGEDPTPDEDQSTLVQFTTAIYFVEESDTWQCF